MQNDLSQLITRSINNAINQANFWPMLINTSRDNLIELQNESNIFVPLRKMGYLNAMGNYAGMDYRHDTDQALYSVKSKASTSLMRNDIINTGDQILYYSDRTTSRIQVPKYRYTNHADPFMLEDWLKSQTFTGEGAAIDLYQEYLRGDLISQHSMHVKAKDIALLEALSGRVQYGVNVEDGTGTGTNINKTFTIDPRVLAKVQRNDIDLQTLEAIEEAYRSYKLIKPKEPLIGIVGSEVFNILKNQLKGFGGYGVGQLMGAAIRYIGPNAQDNWFTTGEAIQVGNFYIILATAEQEEFCMFIDSVTPANSRLGMILVTKKAIAQFNNIRTRIQENLEAYSGMNSFKRGAMTELDVYAVQLCRFVANEYFDSTLIYSSSAFTIVPDEFTHAGLFKFAASGTTLALQGAGTQTYDFTGTTLTNIITRVQTDYNNGFGDLIVNTQTRNAQVARFMGVNNLEAPTALQR